MLSSSVKVERELLAQEGSDLDIVPLIPRPMLRGPYVDTQYYAKLRGPRQSEVLPRLRELVIASGYVFPNTVDPDVAVNETARGLYRKLRNLLPDHVWRGVRRIPKVGGVGGSDPKNDLNEYVEEPMPETEAMGRLFRRIQQRVDRALVASVFGSIYREFRIGPARVRSSELAEVEIGVGKPVSKRFQNETSAVATIEDLPLEGQLPLAVVRYNFTRGDEVRLSSVVDLPFDARGFKRVSLDIRPDDTWHELYCTVELVGGVVYQSKRHVPLGNFTPITLAWQKPSSDDYSTKIKTWVPLKESRRQSAFVKRPSQLRPDQMIVTFTLRRAGQGRAVLNKARFNYDRVFDHMPFWRYLHVSVFLVVANIVLTLLFSSLVAFAFARLNWPGREFCFVLMLATMMIPPQVTMIPHFLIWKNVGAYNTLTPLWLGPVFGTAFFIFLLRQFMRGIPRDLEDAARIDGCGFIGIYWHIILPLIKPSLAAIAIFTFMGTWNDFMGPLIYIADQRLYPLAFGLYAFAIQVQNDPALTMAAALLMTLPVIIVFFLAQKYFIQGVTLTGIKG